MPSRRIVLTTFGSLGDLHPYLAIALGLKARGHEVRIATGECYRRKIEALGLGFRPARPDCDWVTDTGVMRRFMHPRWGLIRVIRELLLPVLRESYQDTMAAVEDADLLVANQAAYAARLVAERKGMPWISAMHVPSGFFSCYDPPLLPGFPGSSKALRFLGSAFWGPLGRLLKRLTRRLAKPWYHLREELGLPPAVDVNPLVDGQSPLLHLALFSGILAGKQRDWPPQTVVTGFPWFHHVDHEELSIELGRFLDAGPPPLVFTLGSAVAADAGGFFEESAAAARLLGRRAILIVNQARNRPTSLPADVPAFDYAPFSALFPRAAAIVHHGGIGTTGLTMRSGRPMLVVPFAWDQPDNAERAARLGIARTISRGGYRAPRVAAELRRLLEKPVYSHRARVVRDRLLMEDGTRAACDAVEAVL
jgi:UDP:flavonoid glycosyltransferase YjiC (YdhE family)